jgi:cell division protein FtsI (penicillin-binding protein 3)
LTKKRTEPLRTERWVQIRILVVTGLLGLCLLLMMYKAYSLQVANGDHYLALAQKQHLSSVVLTARRGPIYDRRGRELAVTADAESVVANPRKVVNVSDTAEKLAAILGKDVRDMEAKLASPRHFAFLARHVDPKTADDIRDLNLAGISIELEPRRYYPGKNIAAPVLGMANIDGRGLDGIELVMQDFLEGKKARRSAFRDVSGRLMMAEGGDGTSAEPGAAVTLTLDRNIQYTAESALARAVDEHEAKAGIAIVLEVSSGEVLAMANWPTFDPNRPSTRGKARNRAITDLYEIGSVMKLVTIAGALESGVITPESTFDIEKGRIKIGRKVIRDSYRDDMLDVTGIMKRSSNVGTIKIARRLGKDGLHDTLRSFGFGSKTDIELPGERKGTLHPTKRWGEIGLATASYGYGYNVTPLQVAAAYAAVGNGGIYNEPRVVKEIRDHQGVPLFESKSQKRRVLRPETAASLLPMLAAVFDKGRNGGTARELVVDGFAAGGKTGTSYKIDPKTHKYSDNLYVSSFAGLAPIDDPKIAVVIVIDEPHGEEHYGSKVAGPAFADIVSGTLKYLGVPSTTPAPEAADQDETTEKPPRRRPKSDKTPTQVAFEEDDSIPIEIAEFYDPETVIMIPDFRGLSMRRALDLAREHKLQVSLRGSGVVVDQQPLPGPAARDSECYLTFGQP